MSVFHKISGCDDHNRKADVVFIHGLGGDAFETWRHDESTSWPHWLGEEFPNVGVWSLGYEAKPFKKTGLLGLLFTLLGFFFERFRNSGQAMALPDRALQVLELMVQHGIGDRPLLLIGHSLGGLLTKAILRAADGPGQPRYQKVISATRAVLFLATPHQGAIVASVAEAFRVVFGPTVSLGELKAHDAHLLDLYNWYRRHASSHAVETVTYYETIAFKGVTVVNATSSQACVGRDAIAQDEDHLSIAKPREPRAQVCLAVVELLREHVLKVRKSPEVPAPAVPSGGSPIEKGPVGSVQAPLELPPAAEDFIGRSIELADLTRRLRARKNTAVVGPAGFGKTTLAAKALRDVAGESAETVEGSPYPNGVVYLDLYTLRGNADAAWDALATRVMGSEFMERSPQQVRAAEACRWRRLLVVVEGGEEADGNDGRARVEDILAVLSSESRWLLLTRLSTQSPRRKPCC